MSNSEIALVVENTEEKAAARNRNSNSEATVEISSMKNEDGSSRKLSPPKEESHDPQESFLQKWKKIFLASCLFALLLDPLFLYVPMLKDDVKCLQSDRNLKIAALLLRSFTDLFYIFDIIFQIYRSDYFAGLMNEYRRRQYFNYSKIKFCCEHVVPTIAKTIWGSYHILIDILAILPLPQVREGLCFFVFFLDGRESLC